MSAECLKGSGLILLHLQTGNWFCHLPEARRDLQEQDYPVQMFWKALSVSPWRSSREKPSHMQSDVTPPHPEKESSLHVPSCCRALQQCAGGVCKKRWMQGSGMGGALLALCSFVLAAWTEHWAASCWGQQTEWKAAPCRDLFCPSATSLCSSLAGFGNEPPSLEEFMCSQVRDQQLPLPVSGTAVELASRKRLQVCALHVHAWQDIFRSELHLEMKSSEYSVWFGKENVKMWCRCLSPL